MSTTTPTQLRLYDISVPIRHSGIVYPGNPEIHVSASQSIAAGAGANVSSIAFGSHTATHVDAPLHFIDGGRPVDEIPLETLIGPARLVRFAGDVLAIGERDLVPHNLEGCERVLLATRNSALLAGKEFVRDYTYLAPGGAEYLASLGVILVGIDYLSVEQFRSGHHRTHHTLLGREIVIVEGLDLSKPEAGEYELICLPLRMEGLDGAPARVVLRG